jgi:S1-C subfamily serine protease|tara:strand:- start:5089 stop:6045 length:957 start_codon:yes stop_codon:yes gene_type:complete
MARLNLDSTKVLIISIVLLLVATSSLILYYNNRINEQNKDFNMKLSGLNEDINANINKLKYSIGENISSLKDDLTIEIQVVDNNLRNFKKQNDEEINTLTDLIDEIEKQSEIQLGELKDELKSIRVKSKDFTAIIDDVLQSVVSVGTNKGLGSGAIIDDRGFIVTNFHVVEDASIIRILTYQDEVYDANLIGYDAISDIAVLKVDASLSELRFGDSNNVEIGERVIALGNPAGLSFTVTEGIVSALHRKGPNNLEIYLQTDVPINPGNSGGPLVDANSRIIGINNFKIGGFEGLGFAIESNSVEQIAEGIIEQHLQQT